MRILLLLFLISLSFSALSQRVDFRGVVKDSITMEKVHGAHVKNISLGKFTISKPDGTFLIPAQAGDTIVFSYIGYIQIGWIVKEEWFQKSDMSFLLREETIHLEEVVVGKFPEYSRFQQLILETEPVDSVLRFDLPKVVVYEPPTAQEMNEPGLAPSIGIPFNMEGLTKKGKEKRKMQQILEHKGTVDLAYRKFNREWVAKETKLAGDELTNFIAYCKFTPEYLADTPLYDIHRRMMALLEDFKADQNKT